MTALPGLDDATTVRLDHTPDGRRLLVARPVAASADSCWQLLIDTEQWPAWGPSVSAVDCPDRYVETGTTGRVQVAGGPWVPFEITDCREYRWTWRVGRIPATGHYVTPGDPTRIGFEVPLLAAGYVPVCGKALQKLAALAER